MKVISYRHKGEPGVGVVVGTKGVIALSKAAPGLPDDLRKILRIDPTLATADIIAVPSPQFHARLWLFCLVLSYVAVARQCRAA